MSTLRFDPFRELDRWANEVMGAARTPRLMPMDAYRHGESYVLRLDLPGIDADSMDITAENNTLTVRAERRNDAPEGAQYVLAERPSGTYSRQIVLGDGLDVDNIAAEYQDGVLTVTIPVAEQAKPRRIQVGRTSGGPKAISESEGTTAADRAPTNAGVAS
jgi:HSP20 family protein